jgi:hypothetical protein
VTGRGVQSVYTTPTRGSTGGRSGIYSGIDQSAQAFCGFSDTSGDQPSLVAAQIA